MSQPPNQNPNTPANPFVPWNVRKGIFRSIGQNDFVVPPREPSPIVEMPMSPSSARSSPARFIPGYNRSMSPRITIEESPFSPPPQTPSTVKSPPVFVNPQQPLLQSPMSPPVVGKAAGAQPQPPLKVLIPSPVVREVPIQQEPPRPRSSSEVII